MKVSIVIPTYNKCDELLKPLCESIIKYTELNDIEIIIVANGCTDNTEEYVKSLGPPFKIIVHPDALGYTKSTNIGILASSGEFILLLNNDCIILPQQKNWWIDCLIQPFENDKKVGITGPLKSFCGHAKREFMVFFCVMIKQNLFNQFGLLDITFSPGGAEDTDFSIKVQNGGYKILQVPGDELKLSGGLMVGCFPIYHAGEKTVGELSNWQDIFSRNSHYLAKKYDPNYRYELTNGFERAVFLNNDEVSGLELTRYKWARENIIGNSMLEIGSTSGYGSQFFPAMEYTGVDYEKKISDVSRWEFGDKNHTFVHADINSFDLQQYDNIVAFEVIEHLDNGLELVEKLKKHCKNLLITVPYKEPQGFWGHHHKLFGIDESGFKDFNIKYIDANGDILDQPNPHTFNLMLMRYQNHITR